MKLFNFALAAALSLGLANTAQAALIPATGSTTVQIVPALTVAPLGTAVDRGGNAFSFPVTGIEENGAATTLFHQGSGLLVGGVLRLENFSYTLGGTPAFPISLFANVDGGMPPVAVFSIDDELAVDLAVAALGFPAGTNIGQVTDVEYRAVHEPTSLLLLASALAIAARRIRR